MDKKTKYLLMFIIMLFGLAVMCCICRNINSSNKDDPVSVNERDLYRRNENDWTLSRHVRDAKVERPKKKKKRRAGKKKNKTGKGRRNHHRKSSPLVLCSGKVKEASAEGGKLTTLEWHDVTCIRHIKAVVNNTCIEIQEEGWYKIDIMVYFQPIRQEPLAQHNAYHLDVSSGNDSNNISEQQVIACQGPRTEFGYKDKDSHVYGCHIDKFTMHLEEGDKLSVVKESSSNRFSRVAPDIDLNYFRIEKLL